MRDTPSSSSLRHPAQVAAVIHEIISRESASALLKQS